MHDIILLFLSILKVKQIAMSKINTHSSMAWILHMTFITATLPM